MQSTAPESRYPLSPMQQGMLFHSLYAPESGVNVQQIVGTLRHSLDIPQFRDAWNQVVRRHGVLRTAFQWEGLKTPLQVVLADVELPFEVEDWGSFSVAERDRMLQKYLKKDRRRGFDLGQAPLMRLALFRAGDAEFQFVWTFHHAMLDGRSFAPLLKEVLAFYSAAQSGTELKLAEPRPFSDFIQWLEQQDFSQAEPFWRERLKGFRAPTPLMVDATSAPAANQAVEYGEDSLLLSAMTTGKLKQLGEQHGLGMSGMVQGAWALLLARYSGEDDVV